MSHRENGLNCMPCGLGNASPGLRMERIFSLSALDSLLQDPEAKADLRHHMEQEELEDHRRTQPPSHHLGPPAIGANFYRLLFFGGAFPY